VPIQQQINPYSDPFLAQQLEGTQTQINPYAQQGAAVGGQAFFQDATSFKHPLNYHLYASIGPRRENLASYQRSTADFFIPDDLREELQRASEASLQTFANSTLPHTIEHFHSLVALDTNNTKGPTTFGYPSWVYKATSSKDGHTYALRRIEGFRLSSEASIRTVNSWKRINSASLVQVHDAFTGRWFGDSSLIIVTDYHPRSQTLAEKHFAIGRHPHRPGVQITPEHDLWGHIVQLASALKTIHEGGVAAQTVMASKVLVTSKNRLRINGCGVFDILQHEQKRPLHELQRADLQDLGRLILGIATRNMSAHQNLPKALELVSRSYSERLRSCIAWLLVPPPLEAKSAEKTTHSTEYNINSLLTSIADKVVSTLDSALHHEDELTSNLMQELENGRLVRLLTKLNVILERPDTTNTPTATSNPALLNQPSAAWSETGERYYLKLFRDYVFHQVDHEGRPVLDLGHIITCLNKLDAGIDEKFQLVSRDEQSIFITSYKEVKRGFEAAWAEISKASNPARR
jgi:PAB-dependent poly(A)-specific ribonuclease subunit 3